MTIDEGLNELARQQYPYSVDVVQAVMAEVRQHPYLQPVRRVQPWQRVLSSSIAAVMLALIGFGTMMRIQAHNDAGIGSMIAQVQDYNYYGSTVEDAALNPIEYIYEE